MREQAVQRSVATIFQVEQRDTKQRPGGGNELGVSEELKHQCTNVFVPKSGKEGGGD